MPINVHGQLDFPENPTESDLYVDEENTQWRYNSGKWAIFEPYYIDDLPDVIITDPEIDDILEWDGSHRINKSGGIHDISDLEDVILTNPQDNEFLIFNGTNWVNGSIGVKHFCSVYISQIWNPNTIGLNDPYLIEYDTVKYDTNSLWDAVNFKIVIQQTGLYVINSSWHDRSSGNPPPHDHVVKVHNSSNVLKESYLYTQHGFSTTGSTAHENSHELLVYTQLEAGDYIQGWDLRHKRYDTTDPDSVSHQCRLIVEQI